MRDVLFIGSVPLNSASEVFRTVSEHLGPRVRRIPDGEQIGWSRAVRRTIAQHEAFEISRQVPLNAKGRDPIDFFRLKDGYRARDVRLGPYGYADNAVHSYAAFAQLKREGAIAPSTRYQVTLPGPGTSAFFVELSSEVLLPLAREALDREMQEIIRKIPAGELAIQLDIAMEAEHEEYLRRPEAFDQPVHSAFHWTLDQMTESAAWLANRIPSEAELGFHICSIWHHDPSAGQDNGVLVDIANALLKKVARRVDYVHIPIIPEHTETDMAPLGRLRLSGETQLYLGLINTVDGVDGARRRIAIAEKIVTGFGVASYCGLGRPDTAQARGPSAHADPPIPALQRATSDTIRDVLELHRAVAEI
jgi:hypothetical protein